MRLMDKIVKEDRSEENLNNIRTIQVNSPHETSITFHQHETQPEPEHPTRSNQKLEPHTNKTYTPQPSTPIKHAGSNSGIIYWILGEEDGNDGR